MVCASVIPSISVASSSQPRSNQETKTPRLCTFIFFFKQSLNRNVRYKWLLSNKLWWTTNGDSKSFLRDRWWLLPSKPMESEWGRKFQNGESSLPLGLRLRPSREGMAATGALSLLVARDYWRALGDIEKWQRTQTSPVSMTQQVRSQDKYLLVKTL